jgi:hypothetical protein
MLTIADKFFVAVLFLAANAARSRYGIDFGLTDQLASDLVQGIGAALVWLIPNRKG